jgi:hypothetical protein
MKSTVLLTVLLTSSIFRFSIGPEAVAQSGEHLCVRLIADHSHYKLNEVFSFDVLLENCGSQAFHVEQYSIFAPGGNMHLEVRDARGRRVLPQVTDIVDAIVPFDASGKLPVILLNPGYLFGSKHAVPVGAYFIKPGTYFVTIEYRSQLSESATDARPIWELSRPPTKSNRVSITIE